MHYMMHIANRAKLSKNGTYAFSEYNINNIPYIDIFIEPEINHKLTNGCKNVLSRSLSSRNQYRFGEQGLLISTLDNSIFYEMQGTYESVFVDTKYNSYIQNRQTVDLIFIHNHPNNSNFSAADIRHLYTDNSLLGIIAVGNRHSIHIILSNGNCSNIENYISNYKINYAKKNNLDLGKLSKKEIKRIEDSAVPYILNNTNKFNIEYYKYNRRKSDEKK